MEKRIEMTLEEYNKLQEKLDHLILVRRKEVIERLAIARTYGDLSENSEYDAAKDEQADLEKQITDLQDTIRLSKIIDTSMIDKNIVSMGKTVVLLMGDTNKEETYHIVGSVAVDVLNSKISLTSPVGEAIQGKQKGETVTVNAPAGSYNITIVDVIETLKGTDNGKN